MILTLMGMSGAGKSYWSCRLAAHGYTVYNCDELIAGRLSARVGVPLTDADIGAWMGFPYDPEFPQREALFLACESEILREVVEAVAEHDPAQTNCVIDTGGSIVYADPPLLEGLRCCSTVVYLRIDEALHQQMLQAYLRRPRPIIWNGQFTPAPGESRDAALSRCYTGLIRQRERLYERYGDVVLEYDDYRGRAASAEQFLERVRAARPVAGSG